MSINPNNPIIGASSTTSQKEISMSDTQKWLFGIIGSLLLSAGGLYAGWINTAFASQSKVNEKVILHNVDVDFDMEVLNAKLDLLLQANKLRYEGPAFKPHRDHQDR